MMAKRLFLSAGFAALMWLCLSMAYLFGLLQHEEIQWDQMVILVCAAGIVMYALMGDESVGTRVGTKAVLCFAIGLLVWIASELPVRIAYGVPSPLTHTGCMVVGVVATVVSARWLKA